MGLKDEFDKVANNAQDAASEAGHRSEAQGEEAKRDAAGDAMTPGEKLGSVANQAKDNLQADTDSAKRDIRNG